MGARILTILATVFLWVPLAAALRADCNGDHIVNLEDLAIMAEEWMMSDLGPELVTNGGFDDNADGWILPGYDWEYDAVNQRMHITADYASAALKQDIISLVPGKSYHVSGVAGGFQISDLFEIYFNETLSGIRLTETGEFEGVLNAGAGDNQLHIYGELGGSGREIWIDNISLKEVLPDPSPASLASPAGNSLAAAGNSLSSPDSNSLGSPDGNSL